MNQKIQSSSQRLDSPSFKCMRGHLLLSLFYTDWGVCVKMQFCHAYVEVHYINKCGAMCANIACVVYIKNAVGETQKSFALG